MTSFRAYNNDAIRAGRQAGMYCCCGKTFENVRFHYDAEVRWSLVIM